MNARLYALYSALKRDETDDNYSAYVNALDSLTNTQFALFLDYLSEMGEVVYTI